MPIQLSIIVPTVSRNVEFKRFLDSLVRQKGLESIELIVVDQNDNEELQKLILKKKLNFEIVYLKEKKISLSFAKNMGLHSSKGKYICFLDDDCWLDEQFIFNAVNSIVKLDESEGLLMKAMTPKGDFLVPCKLNKGYVLNQKNIKDAFFAPQIAHVYPTFLVKKINGFNEKLGVGTHFGSAEETDLLVRLVYQGVTFFYREELMLYHPEVSYFTMTPQKSFQYGLGFGAFCRIHGWTGYWLYKIFRSFTGMVVNFFSNHSAAKSYFNTLKGRFKGFLYYK